MLCRVFFRGKRDTLNYDQEVHLWSVQCISGRKQDSAFSHPYFQNGDEMDTKLEVTCSVPFV